MKVTFLNINGELSTTTENLEQSGGYKVISQDGDIAMITVSDGVEMALHQAGVAAENDRPTTKKVPLIWKVKLG